LSRFIQVRDEVGVVCEVVFDHDLVSLALLGFQKSWKGFQDAVSGREKFPHWEGFGLTSYRKRSEEEP